MGFRKDAWATCWDVDVKSDTLTLVRLSTSRKDRDADTYTQDFSGFVAFVGTATAKKAAGLKEKERIKLGDVDVQTTYDKEKNTVYTNFKCYSFEKSDSGVTESTVDTYSEPDVDDIVDDEPLPY